MAFADDDDDDRPGFDSTIAEQLTLGTLSIAQNNQQLNAAMVRNITHAPATVLTLGVQQNSVAYQNQLKKTAVMVAAAAANLTTSNQPVILAGLNTAAGFKVAPAPSNPQP